MLDPGVPPKGTSFGARRGDERGFVGNQRIQVTGAR
jgi:hypothetical protein